MPARPPGQGHKNGQLLSENRNSRRQKGHTKLDPTKSDRIYASNKILNYPLHCYLNMAPWLRLLRARWAQKNLNYDRSDQAAETAQKPNELIRWVDDNVESFLC